MSFLAELNFPEPEQLSLAALPCTLERDDILGIMETEEKELVPLTDDFISSVWQDIHNRFPKVKRKRLSWEEIKQRCHLQVLEEFQE
jgi:hypothetical protein